jgi:MFS family permease
VSARAGAHFPSRTLAALIALGICNHVTLSGARVAVPLDALARGASPLTVGVLVSLFALLPVFLAVPVGRLADRIGVRRPMLWGSTGTAVGAALPFALPGLPALYVAAALIGASFMLFQVPAQRATGDLADAPDRAASFSHLALGYSISGFIGPLAAGLAIDHLGFGPAFAVLAALPLLPVAVLFARRVALPRSPGASAPANSGGIMELIRIPALRRLFVINAAFALGWDLHTIFVPIYGAGIGLSAAAIGAILSAFAAATFLVRLAMPWLAHHVAEARVLTVALAAAGLVYVAFPFVASAWALATLSFVLGLGLGSGQPVVLSLLHEHAPPGRVGEVVGVRMSLIQSMAVAVPLVFGALGTSLGLVPVFWAVGASLGASGWYARLPGRAARAR